MCSKFSGVFNQSISTRPLELLCCSVQFTEHGCMIFWNFPTVHNGFFNLLSIFHAYSLLILSIKVIFFFSPLFHSTLTYFRSNSFFCVPFFLPSSFPNSIYPFSPFLNSIFSKCLLPNLRSSLSKGPSLLQALGNQLTGMASNAMFTSHCSST